MARASTTPAQAPTACTIRHPVNVHMPPASSQPAEPTMNGTIPTATAIVSQSIADRSPYQLAQAKSDEITRYCPFHGAGPSAKGSAHGGHRGEVEVRRDRCEPHEQTKNGEHAPAGRGAIKTGCGGETHVPASPRRRDGSSFAHIDLVRVKISGRSSPTVVRDSARPRCGSPPRHS